MENFHGLSQGNKSRMWLMSKDLWNTKPRLILWCIFGTQEGQRHQKVQLCDFDYFLIIPLLSMGDKWQVHMTQCTYWTQVWMVHLGWFLLHESCFSNLNFRDKNVVIFLGADPLGGTLKRRYVLWNIYFHPYRITKKIYFCWVETDTENNQSKICPKSNEVNWIIILFPGTLNNIENSWKEYLMHINFPQQQI